MRIRSFNFVVFILFALSGLAFGQNLDKRVGDALDLRDIKYQISNSGNYLVEFQMDNNPSRSHQVVVVSQTEKYRDTEIREIWAIATTFSSYPKISVLQELFATNSTIKIGAWAIEEDDDGEVFIIYTVKTPVTISARDLVNLIYFVAEICDEFEEEYSGDDFY